MYKLGWCVITLLAFVSVKSQQIDWENINSNTVFNIIANQNFQQGISYSNILQIGDFNAAELSLNAKTDISVKQFGDYNSLYFINAFSDAEAKTSITTEGYNNRVDITGSNSISDGMKMNVKGDNMTVFMRNY